jgi:hypothetical protein
MVFSMSLNSNFCRVLAGTTLALLLVTLKDWLPGVAGPEPRLGFRFLGRQFKKGACTSPLFSFPVRSPTPGRSAQYSELH